MDFLGITLYNIFIHNIKGAVCPMSKTNLPTVTAIVVAAGASRRMGFDKLSYRLPDGRTVLESADAVDKLVRQVKQLAK